MQGRGRALVLGRVVDLFSLRFMLQQCTQTPLTLPTPPPPPTCPEMAVFEISFIESETLRRESGGGGGGEPRRACQTGGEYTSRMNCDCLHTQLHTKH